MRFANFTLYKWVTRKPLAALAPFAENVFNSELPSYGFTSHKDVIVHHIFFKLSASLLVSF